MKVLMINGSPRGESNTAIALTEMEKIFKENNIEVVTYKIGGEKISGCTACYACTKAGKCVQDDMVNEIAKDFKDADGLVVASPVYYASANGTLISLLDRLFICTGSQFDKTMKVGASVACARRAGSSATFDQLNKYFTFAGMPVASGQNWNNIHGRNPGEAESDEEGKQNMRVLARNMVFLMKSIELGKQAFGLPEKETRINTNFIR